MVFKFTIDSVFVKHLPSNRLERLPRQIRRFLGHHKPKPRSDLLIWLEILVSSFCGIALLEGVFKSHTVFTRHHAPIIIASYGATAILCFNASSAPLSQPRNIFFGHFVSSLIGVCIQKLFSLSQNGRDNYWASGALSVGVSSVVMSILNCVHPPAGASALLPSVDDSIREMSWWYLPAQIISSILMISVALIFGNLIRRYPAFWVTPVTPPKVEDEEKKLIEEEKLNLEATKELEKNGDIKYTPNFCSIKINADDMIVPDNLELNKQELEWLIHLQCKLTSK